MADYNVKDFGAVGDGVANDRSAIQAALDAAYAAGGGTVIIPKGVYSIAPDAGVKPTYAGLQIRDNVSIVGEGMGETIIKVADGYAGGMTGIMRTPFAAGTNNVSVRDLTLDGNRDATGGKVDGWFNGFNPGEDGKDTNITLLRVEIKDCSGYGFDPHEQTENILIKDSVSHGNGLDGFVADFQFNGIFEGNVAYDNDRHGFNVVTSTHDFVLRNNVAYGNGANGIVVQRGSENIEHPTDILIEGGEYYDNGLEGILIKLANNVTVDGVKVYDNGTTGVRIYGAYDNTITNSEIYNNSQSKSGGYSEVRFEAYDDRSGVSGQFYDAHGNRVTDNLIYSDGAVPSAWGVSERVFSSTVQGVLDNDVTNNVIYGSQFGAVQLKGAGSDQSGNTGQPTPVDPDLLILGTTANDTLIGGAGDDTIDGGAGRDTLTGGAGADVFRFGHNSHSTETATDRIADFNVLEDKIDLSQLSFTALISGVKTAMGELRLAYSASSDRTYVRSDQSEFEIALNGDYRAALTNAHFIFGSGPVVPVDPLAGTAGNDKLQGTDAAETLSGLDGIDTLIGGDGNDTLDGGLGKDTLTGGAGQDVFAFTSVAHSIETAPDRITDFSIVDDVIDLRGLGFTQLVSTSATALGELRLAYSASSNRTYVRSDQSEFEFFLDGDYRGALHNDDFLFV